MHALYHFVVAPCHSLESPSRHSWHQGISFEQLSEHSPGKKESMHAQRSHLKEVVTLALLFITPPVNINYLAKVLTWIRFGSDGRPFLLIPLNRTPKAAGPPSSSAATLAIDHQPTFS